MENTFSKTCVNHKFLQLHPHFNVRINIFRCQLLCYTDFENCSLIRLFIFPCLLFVSLKGRIHYAVIPWTLLKCSHNLERKNMFAYCSRRGMVAVIFSSVFPLFSSDGRVGGELWPHNRRGPTWGGRSVQGPQCNHGHANEQSPRVHRDGPGPEGQEEDRWREKHRLKISCYIKYIINNIKKYLEWLEFVYDEFIYFFFNWKSVAINCSALIKCKFKHSQMTSCDKHCLLMDWLIFFFFFFHQLSRETLWEWISPGRGCCSWPMRLIWRMDCQ